MEKRMRSYRALADLQIDYILKDMSPYIDIEALNENVEKDSFQYSDDGEDCDHESDAILRRMSSI